MAAPASQGSYSTLYSSNHTGSSSCLSNGSLLCRVVHGRGNRLGQEPCRVGGLGRCGVHALLGSGTVEDSRVRVRVEGVRALPKKHHRPRAYGALSRRVCVAGSVRASEFDTQQQLGEDEQVSFCFLFFSGVWQVVI